VLGQQFLFMCEKELSLRNIYLKEQFFANPYANFSKIFSAKEYTINLRYKSDFFEVQQHFGQHLPLKNKKRRED